MPLIPKTTFTFSFPFRDTFTVSFTFLFYSTYHLNTPIVIDVFEALTTLHYWSALLNFGFSEVHIETLVLLEYILQYGHYLRKHGNIGVTKTHTATLALLD